eukprot:scaffold3700_cov387-Prasinococcus_capsulatus_cf.AAC.2
MVAPSLGLLAFATLSHTFAEDPVAQGHASSVSTTAGVEARLATIRRIVSYRPGRKSIQTLSIVSLEERAAPFKDCPASMIPAIDSSQTQDQERVTLASIAASSSWWITLAEAFLVVTLVLIRRLGYVRDEHCEGAGLSVADRECPAEELHMPGSTQRVHSLRRSVTITQVSRASSTVPTMKRQSPLGTLASEKRSTLLQICAPALPQSAVRHQAPPDCRRLSPGQTVSVSSRPPVRETQEQLGAEPQPAHEYQLVQSAIKQQVRFAELHSSTWPSRCWHCVALAPIASTVPFQHTLKARAINCRRYSRTSGGLLVAAEPYEHTHYDEEQRNFEGDIDDERWQPDRDQAKQRQ